MNHLQNALKKSGIVRSVVVSLKLGVQSCVFTAINLGTIKIMAKQPNKSLKAASLDSLNRRMLRIICAACVCPLAQRYVHRGRK